MNNRNLAKAFADGAEKGKGSHMFIDGDRIYSYGYHFIIAKRLAPKRFVVTTRKYSQSTTRHCYHVKAALANAGHEVVHEAIV